MLCSKCGINPRPAYHAYCNDCKKAYRREHPEDRSKKYKRVAPFPEMCGKCHQRPHAKGHAWCDECKGAAHKEWLDRSGFGWSTMTPEQKQKALARQFVGTRMARGQMQKFPCLICGNEEVTAHHYLGYGKEHALDVLWLCRQHHREAELKLWSPIVPLGYSLKTPLTPKTTQERFDSKVERTLDCWLYTGRLNIHGYGEFDLPDGSAEGAHRFAYRMAYGEIPEGCIVGHLCNVRRCVRPDHLIAWPKGDDVRYMEACGRGVHPTGEANGRCKIPDDDVRAIRRDYRKRTCGCYVLAKRHGVSPQAIFDIVNFKTRTDVK